MPGWWRGIGAMGWLKRAVEFVQVEWILFLRPKCYRHISLLLCMCQQLVIVFNISVSNEEIELNP